MDKKTRTTIPTVMLLVALHVMVTGCASVQRSMMDPDPGGNVTRMLDRLGRYVTADANLDPTVRDGYVADINAYRAVMRSGEGDEGYIHVDTAEPMLAPLVALHDAYVTGDASLDPDVRTVYLTTTDLIRGQIAAAKGGTGDPGD